MNSKSSDTTQGGNSAQDRTVPLTFAHEDQLPRVPLPTLEESCARFLAWCAPLLTPAELAVTETEVTAFLQEGGPGRKLHDALQRYEATEGVHSWLDTFWPYRYLGRRDRIALNANFFFLFQDPAFRDPAFQNTPESTDSSPKERQLNAAQVKRAAGLIAAAVNYKRRLDQELIAPVVQRGQAQSMEQHKFLFSTTRIPGTTQDTVRAPYTEMSPGPSPARHIVVFFKGAMHRMDVLGPEGVPYTLDDLETGLRAVLKTGAAGAEADTCVGHLTTMARAEWADARQDLLAHHPRNASALDEVETALFCLSLEDFAPKDTLAACDRLLHGDSHNRWFDKAVSLIVFADGQAGINVEHCELDGTTVLAFVDALLGSPAEEQSRQSGARSQGQPPVEPIEFALDAGLRVTVRSAAEAFAAYGANTASLTVSFDDFGANVAKRLSISPDAFAQCAYQLAHKRTRGHLGATYESIATRQYRGGRTEAMRVVTPQMVEFVAAMEDPGADVSGRQAAFRAAASQHVARAKECQTGQAPEQHLWELLLIQRRRGAELGVDEPPALYQTPGWLIMRDDYLSTSSAPSPNIRFFGFGSTSSRCIGVGYVMLPERFNLYLSAPRPVAGEMEAFADRLREAVRELTELLVSET